MVVLKANIEAFATSDTASTAIEYSLIAALIAVACIAAMGAFGSSLLTLFNYVRDTGGNAMDNAGI